MGSRLGSQVNRRRTRSIATLALIAENAAMTAFWRATLLTLNLIPLAAAACQPPPDMPPGDREQELYWKRHVRITQQFLVRQASTLLVGQAKVVSTNEAQDTSMVRIAPIRLLRGSAPGLAPLRAQTHMCRLVNPNVYSGEIYLFALDGREVLLAVPLIKGQEKAGVRALMNSIGAPQLWN